MAIDKCFFNMSVSIFLNVSLSNQRIMKTKILLEDALLREDNSRIEPSDKHKILTYKCCFYQRKFSCVYFCLSVDEADLYPVTIGLINRRRTR